MTQSLSCLVALLAAGSLVQAELSFSFDYTLSAEFNDPTHGAARRMALEDAAASLGAIIDHNAEIVLEVTSSNDISNNTLAFAFSQFKNVPGSTVGYVPGIVLEKILTGNDGNGAAPDGEVNVNFGWDWDFDDEVSPQFFDFKATMIHEILHTMGFLSGIFEDGSDAFGRPIGTPGLWEPFDDFLSDQNGVPLIDDTTFELSNAWPSLSVGGASPSGGLFFNGPKARAANEGQPVGLYSPTFWENGSSGSHLDDENPNQAGLLMLAATTPGQYRRTLSAIERAILQDLGYRLHPLQKIFVEVESVTPGTSAQLQLNGADGWYAIERSEDLINWNQISVVQLEGGPKSVTVPLAVADTKLFFRMVEATAPPLAPAPDQRPMRRAKR